MCLVRDVFIIQMLHETITRDLLTLSYILKLFWKSKILICGLLKTTIMDRKMHSFVMKITHANTHTHSLPRKFKEQWNNKSLFHETHYFGINAPVISDVSPDNNSDCCNKDCMFDYLDTCHA